MADTDHYDLVIVGGGMVGASLAIALGGSALRIALLEAVPFRSASQPSYDDRAIALAYGTHRIFAAMDLWDVLRGEATPIHSIHISDRGHFGFTRLDCRDEGVEALGYVAVSRAMGAVLAERLQQLSNVEVICPATVTNVVIGGCHAEVEIDGDAAAARRLTASLVVAADGAKSQVREWLGIGTVHWDYGQTAVITNVTPEHPHHNRAFERFTDSGPLALLPMSEKRCSVVWTVRSELAEDVTAMDDVAFLNALQRRFGGRLGTFQRVGARRAYPLMLVRAKEHVRPRLALIGNAAHTLHPVAGQGFNLGLRDVAVLAEVLYDAAAAGRDIGDMQVLQSYARWRRRDHSKMIAFTDGLARVFANPLTPLRLLRNAGLLAVDMMPPLKHVLTRHTMGLAGRLPRLARGLPLVRSSGIFAAANPPHPNPLPKGEGEQVKRG
ncbi:MAG: 2-octaprenyl-6-methoxyphenyl hydroxylase [Gammaproteobacteria bacterium]|jgi:2-octaprenyl-6-methoxyphenol hydroxylase